MLMNKRNSLPLNSGFSLVELTCALAVVSIGFGGVFHIYLHGLEKMRAVDEYEMALCALNNEIETLRAQPWDTLTPGEALSFRSTPLIDGLHLAETQVTIQDVPEGPPGLRQATVQIRWIGEYGRHIEKTLTTLIARTDSTPPTKQRQETANGLQ